MQQCSILSWCYLVGDCWEAQLRNKYKHIALLHQFAVVDVKAFNKESITNRFKFIKKRGGGHLFGLICREERAKSRTQPCHVPKEDLMQQPSSASPFRRATQSLPTTGVCLTTGKGQSLPSATPRRGRCYLSRAPLVGMLRAKPRTPVCWK